MTLDISQHQTPIGPMTAIAEEGRLALLEFSVGEARIEGWLSTHFPGAARVPGDPWEMRRRLEAYFVRQDFAAFDELEIAFHGPPFHCQVWRELCRIPAGATRSYGELAKRLGKPGAARAVGYANSQNPNAIVVPCHRVIGGNGTLTGYAGGLERKHWLLLHEGAILL